MKNILVPIGSSGNATNTLQYAIDFAKAIQAKIYIVKVYDTTRMAGSLKNVDILLEEDSISDLNEVIDNVDKKGVQVSAKSIKGQVIDSIKWLAKELEIDLIVSSAQSISTDETLFLGKVPGSLVKDTELPILIVPAQYRFKSISKILMAIKSGKIKPGKALEPVNDIEEYFGAKIDLIQVITPKSTEEDLEVSEKLKKLSSSFKTTENATIFQGVLEHLHQTEPDMLCVLRRKRGFFSKLWEKDTVKKSNFESRIPLLVLKGIV
jgi:nucleotide-binding universal stress UspA family protein